MLVDVISLHIFVGTMCLLNLVATKTDQWHQHNRNAEENGRQSEGNEGFAICCVANYKECAIRIEQIVADGFDLKIMGSADFPNLKNCRLDEDPFAKWDVTNRDESRLQSMHGIHCIRQSRKNPR